MKRISLLGKILIAIVSGIGLGYLVPQSVVRVFVTFNLFFGEFLAFAIPLIVVGLVTVAIADIGKNAGRMLFYTLLLSYSMTLFSGFTAYWVGDLLYPSLIDAAPVSLQAFDQSHGLTPYFSLSIKPVLEVMPALLLAFLLGSGIAYTESRVLKEASKEFQQIIFKMITVVILPLLPIYILGVFMNMTATGMVYTVLITFIKVIGVIFVLHIALLLFQYLLAGIVVHRNPLRLLKVMLPAYFTALGTQSSAATIPVTLVQTKKNGVTESVANFVIPICATIHLSGSTLKIVSCALALMIMQGQPYDLAMFSAFIFVLGITMVAAPGVPGGAIMASLGVLQSMLAFDEPMQAMMIALYITMDSFGTACNVTGDGALALILDKIQKREKA